MTTKFQKARLLKLADLLDADAANKKGIKFDLSNWGYATEGERALSCGTTACAMGLAVASKAFARQGLTSYGDNFCPVYEGKVGFEAAAFLFGIGMNEAFFLFSDDYYPSNKSKGADGERFVAKRIRAFVKNRSIVSA